MTDGPVVCERRDGVVTLRLNRPETLNAMNEAMMAEFERLLPQIAADATVRAVALTGTGRAFSSGGDQKRDRGQEAERKFFDGDLGGGVVERLHRCILHLQRMPKPVIASVNGVAVGAGCNLALAADLRIGLVNWVKPAHEWQAETDKLAERLAQGPTLAYGMAKSAVYQGLEMSLEDVLNVEARNQAIAGRSQDCAEGVAAFLEKRQPRFIGR